MTACQFLKINHQVAGAARTPHVHLYVILAQAGIYLYYVNFCAIA